MTTSAWAIHQLDADQAAARRPALTDLLITTVAGGASVGFLPPLERAEAEAYWRSVEAAVQAGERWLWTAETAGQVAGTVQVELCLRANGRHRAEVMKLLVAPAVRRQGLGRALMLAAEAAARAAGRTTLVLDTRAGDLGEPLYQALGWIQAGVIPQYARAADGRLDATVFYYKLLGG